MTNNVIQYQRLAPSSSYRYSTGNANWSENLLGSRPTQVHTPTAETVFLTIPIVIDRPWGQFGFKLQEIYIPYIMDVAAPTAAISPLFGRADLDNPTTGTGSNPTQTDLTSTVNISFQQGQTVTSGTNLSTTGQAIIITPKVPAWESEAGALNRRTFYAQLQIPFAATTTFRIYDSMIRYDLPIG